MLSNKEAAVENHPIWIHFLGLKFSAPYPVIFDVQCKPIRGHQEKPNIFQSGETQFYEENDVYLNSMKDEVEKSLVFW